MHDGLTVGIARANITPSLTVPHGGWGAQTHLLADGVHEELFVTVIYFGQGDTRTVIVEFDLVGLYSLAVDVRRAVAEEIGIPSDAVRVVVTHNHANPVMWEHWVGDRGDQVELYKSTLPAKAAGAARMAMANARPARLRVGRGSCHIGRNRRQRLSDGRIVVGRNDDGVTDPDVFVVRFDDLDGEPIVGLMGYTCHPTTLGPDNRLMSPDYPGVAKRVFQRATGVPSLFLQGATGNVGPRMGFTADIRVVERLGTILGLEAAKVFSEIDTRPITEEFVRARESGATLAMWEEKSVPEEQNELQVRQLRLPLPLRPQPELEEVLDTYRQRKSELSALNESGAPAEKVEAAMFRARRAQMAVTRVENYAGKTELEVELQILRYGELAIVGMNGEPFCEIGLAIKEQAAVPHTFFGGYTGESFGYIPWPQAYSEGGYEVETSPYTEEAAPRIVEAVLKVLAEMTATDRARPA